MLSALLGSTLILLFIWVSCISIAKAEDLEQTQKVSKVTKIRITIDDKHITATLKDNATTRDFLALLPLTLTLDDFNKTEKISELPQRLSTEGAPEGFDPKTGDITYYAPWGNLAIFYRNFKYSPGLISLGRIDSGIELLKSPATVLIEQIKE